MRKPKTPKKKAAGVQKKKAATSAKKTSGPASQKKGKDALVKKLSAAVKNLDEAGVGFLLQQAEVLLHNMKVSKLNEERRKLVSDKKTSKPAPLFDKKSIEVIEADDLRHFILVINNARNFFTRDEMRKLAAICQNAAGAEEGSRSLYNWFARFRKDVLIDVGIDSPSDIALGVMYNAIRKRYAPK